MTIERKRIRFIYVEITLGAKSKGTKVFTAVHVSTEIVREKGWTLVAERGASGWKDKQDTSVLGETVELAIEAQKRLYP